MNIKKVISSVAAAAMTASILASSLPAFAAGSIDLTMDQKTVKAGESFTLEFKVDNLTENIAQGFEFSIGYDPSLISIESLSAGEVINDAKASEEEVKLNPDITGSIPMISGGSYSCFDYNINTDDKSIEILWGTGLKDSSFWLDTDGILFTLNGKVAADAKPGSVADFTIGKIDREANVEIIFGATDGSTDIVRDTKIVQNGKVTVASEEAKIKTSGELKKTMYFSYAEQFDKTGISVIATVGGKDVDITADCKFANTPVGTYDKKGFNYKASLIYDGKDEALADFVGKEVASYDVKIGQRGDANLDHQVTPADASKVCEYDAASILFPEDAILSKTDNELALYLADADLSGSILPADASAICEYDAQYAFEGDAARWKKY